MMPLPPIEGPFEWHTPGRDPIRVSYWEAVMLRIVATMEHLITSAAVLHRFRERCHRQLTWDDSVAVFRRLVNLGLLRTYWWTAPDHPTIRYECVMAIEGEAKPA